MTASIIQQGLAAADEGPEHALEDELGLDVALEDLLGFADGLDVVEEALGGGEADESVELGEAILILDQEVRRALGEKYEVAEKGEAHLQVIGVEGFGGAGGTVFILFGGADQASELLAEAKREGADGGVAAGVALKGHGTGEDVEHLAPLFEHGGVARPGEGEAGTSAAGPCAKIYP